MKINKIVQIKMEPREFHIWHFPEEKVRINKRNSWDLKIQILELLSNREAAQAKEIASKLPIDYGNTVVNLNKLHKKGLVQKTRFGYGNKWFLTERGTAFLKKWSIKNKEKMNKVPDWHKVFKLSNDNFRILLTSYGRKRLFLMLKRIFKNQDEIANYLQVHRNTISSWETGKCKMPLIELTKALDLLYKKGADLSNEIATNIYGIRSLNGRYKIHGGYENGVGIHRTFLT